ncbi:pterin binding enzyme family protein [Mycobacterium xenopi 4042]|uniref:Pterin binding enzyme family protein n=1 Tax=Mycobacterium xenopi 4042 TaxID=1299334 RepID=X7ZVV9_MYCXE|nr:pterin binding enzyme family protein [Mycobacterium xenopi 4042]
MAAEGAAIIDVGGESTRPGAVRIEPQVETARVVPVVKQLAAQGVTVSIDTIRAGVARAALESGAGSSTTSPVGAPTQRWRRC